MKKILIIFLVLVGMCQISQAQLLYKISGNGLRKDSYIIGTYHLADASFADEIPGANKVLKKVGQVCGETSMIDMLNPDSVTMIMKSMRLPEGQTLQSLLTKEQFDKLDAFYLKLTGQGLSNPMVLNQVNKFSPSFLSNNIQVLFCMKREKKVVGQNTLDTYFQKKALELGKSVRGFESLAFQTSVLNSGSLERQVELLMCTVDNADFVEAQMGHMIDAYYAQDVQAIEKAMSEEMDGICKSTQEEMDILVNDRNMAWIKQMPEMMKEKSTLFAVGAGHLFGEQGLIPLLKQQGYEVEAVK